jgi:hypothetical protein
MIDLTFQHGLSPYSALGFALTSNQHLSKKADVDSAERFARLAVAILDRVDGQRLNSKVCSHAGFALHWRQPLSQTVDFWVNAYQHGMRN